MVEATVEIRNKSGLHARPAAILVQEAGKHACKLWVKKGDYEVDAKSILGIMSLAVSAGETITVKADGSDEKEALASLVQLIESGLGES